MRHPGGLLDNQAGLNLLACRQLEQRGAAQYRLESSDGLAHQQWLFLPVLPHELGRAKTSEKLQRLIYIHGTIVG